MLVRQFGKQAGPLESLIVCVSLCLRLGAPSLKALGRRSIAATWAAAFPNCHSASQNPTQRSVHRAEGEATEQGMCWAERLRLCAAPLTSVGPLLHVSSGMSCYLRLIAVSDHSQDPPLEVLHVGHT